MEYRADENLMRPALLPITSWNYTLEPVFSPDYAADRLILVGASRPVEVLETGRLGHGYLPGSESVVYRCTPLRCDAVVLDGVFEPSIRLSPAFGDDRLGFAFITGSKLFRSRDGARTFTGLDLPPGETSVTDLAIRGPSERHGPLVVASFTGSLRSNGLYKSGDQGTTWTPIPADIAGFEQGFDTVALAGSHGTILAAAFGEGIACSSDDGETWSTRC
jgi:hypothetical protein